LKSRTAVIVVTSYASISCAIATDKNTTFEGTISATLTRAGTQVTNFEFNRKGNLLRVENTTNKLEPINIVDLAANKLTIIYPHNTTFVRVDLTKRAAPVAGVADPGLGAARMPTASMQMGPGSAIPATTPQIGPEISPPPGFSSPPPMPSIPPMPNNPMAAAPGMGMPSIPMMPPMPAMPGISGSTELKKTDKTKKIQGFECTLYTMSDRMETFEIWATNDSNLFPFRLIERDYLGRRFGPQMIEETWPEKLREKSLFPLEATLKMDPGGQERLTFKIDKIDSAKADKIDPKLFQPPDKYIEIQASQF
jgi:hypothetical protein